MATGRDAKMTKWDMVNGSSVWVRGDTMKNIDKVFTFVKAGWSKANDRKKFRLTYSQIQKGTRLKNPQVRYAVFLLSFKINPFLKFHAKSFRGKSGVKVTHKVELIRSE